MGTLQERLYTLEDQLDRFIDQHPELRGQRDTSDQEERYQQTFIKILAEICSIIDEADTSNAQDLTKLIEKVDVILSKAVGFACDGTDEGQLLDLVPSFAHSDRRRPMLSDERPGLCLAHDVYLVTQYILNAMQKSNRFSEPLGKMPGLPPPWSATIRLHMLSSRCARFSENPPSSFLPEEAAKATSVFQARCEITVDAVPAPIKMSASNDGKCLVIPSMGGWKERDPYLAFCFPTEGNSQQLAITSTRLPLSHIVHHSFVDTETSLMFVGDGDRIKSFTWQDSPLRLGFKKLLPVHTMDSFLYDGPITLLANRKLARSGKGQIAIWDLEGLQTHGPKGTKIIGKKLHLDSLDAMADVHDESSIEASSGTHPHAIVPLPSTNYTINEWHPHPSAAGAMLASSGPRLYEQYHCHALDLENGKCIARFLGHGASINGFSSSKGDPNVFVTACNDGYARLFDVRHPLPVLTVAGDSYGPCPAAVLCHPDSIPFLFVGAESGQHIKLWDIRARASVYELATGNNAVVGMAWNDEANHLYAATECNHLDRNGCTIGYRLARLPFDRASDSEDSMKDGEYNDAEWEIDGDGEDVHDQCWPVKAFYAETYFGHIFDSAQHRIYRYAFKMDANPDILPPDGGARVSY